MTSVHTFLEVQHSYLSHALISENHMSSSSWFSPHFINAQTLVHWPLNAPILVHWPLNAPFLFVMMAEVLNRLLVKAEQISFFQGLKVGAGQVNITHL